MTQMYNPFHTSIRSIPDETARRMRQTDLMWRRLLQQRLHLVARPLNAEVDTVKPCPTGIVRQAPKKGKGKGPGKGPPPAKGAGKAKEADLPTNRLIGIIAAVYVAKCRTLQ